MTGSHVEAAYDVFLKSPESRALLFYCGLWLDSLMLEEEIKMMDVYWGRIEQRQQDCGLQFKLLEALKTYSYSGAVLDFCCHIL